MVVDVEGLRYVVRQGRRLRRVLFGDAGGKVTQRPNFGFAAWAEPVLAPDSVIP
ncbi:hypothetical protein [Streptomyces sp. NPDC001492]